MIFFNSNVGKVKEKDIGQFQRTKSLFNFQRLGIMPLNWLIGTIALDGKCFCSKLYFKQKKR